MGIGSAKERHLVKKLRMMTLKKKIKIKDHEGSKRKVKENHDSHRFSQREAFSDNTKKDDTKENNKMKNKDHEGSKRKVKENHDSHRISYKRAIINTIKNDDIEKRNKKIIVQKNPKELKPWRSRSKEIKNTSVIKEETSEIEKEVSKKEEKEIKIEPKIESLPETKND